MLLGDEVGTWTRKSLTRLRDFLAEKEVTELSLPVYDSNRGQLHPRELHATASTGAEFRWHAGGRHAKCVLCVICVFCYVMCYVNKTLGKKELVNMTTE